jgi:hypothetical protein
MSNVRPHRRKILDKSKFLQEIRENHAVLREILEDSEVSAALSDIGVQPKLWKLHAPSSSSEKVTGIGETLCGINGTRHKDVTCKKCLKKLASSA